jgi:hypothetical protein
MIEMLVGLLVVAVVGALLWPIGYAANWVGYKLWPDPLSTVDDPTFPHAVAGGMFIIAALVTAFIAWTVGHVVLG